MIPRRKCPSVRCWILTSTLVGVLSVAFSLPVCGGIFSDFDDWAYPGAAGDGWVAAWSNSAAVTPLVDTANPLDNGTPYLSADAGGGVRNVARQYTSFDDVDVTQPHRITWRFRLDEDPTAFESSFTTFNDRVHFFGRNAPRLEAGTDASSSWAFFATGGAHASGVGAGRTFYIFDNLAGDSAFNLNNAVDTGLPLAPQDAYALSLRVDPANQLLAVAITNLSTGAHFASAAPHRFRDLSAIPGSHTILHFGVQSSGAEDVRGFHLDSIAIAPDTALVPPPEILNVYPGNHAIHPAVAGLRFEVRSAMPLKDPGITLELNGSDVTGTLGVQAGEPGQYFVVYNGLQNDVDYVAVLGAENGGGPTSLTVQFTTATGELVRYDSQGFVDDAAYPLGPLQPVTHNGGTWIPAAAPALIEDLLDGQHGKVVRRDQTGGSNIDYLDIAPISAGVLTIAFDARVSTPATRTLDVVLFPAGGGSEASMLGLGTNPNKVSYYDGSAWVAVADLDTQWHRYAMVHYLSGPRRSTFDLEIDGAVIGRNLVWRNAHTPTTAFGRIRFGAMRGAAGTYADYDNLLVTAAQVPAPPPVIANAVPAHRAHFHNAAAGLSFQVSSEQPVDPGDVTLRLDGQDVSAQLAITGDPTNLFVTFNGLEPNHVYTANVSARSLYGEGAATIQFNTIVQKTPVLDTGGFANNTLYPVGALGNVTDGLGVWIPGHAGDPAQIVESGEPAYGKVLRRAQGDSESHDLLDFTPFNAGILTIAFDLKVSTPSTRTLDLSLNRTGQDFRACHLAWGEIGGTVAYYAGGMWNEIADLDDAWHRYELVNHLSGPNAHTFDLLIDGVVQGTNLPWTQAFPATEFFGRLRFAAELGIPGDSADVDNLVVYLTPPPPEIADLVPANLASFHPAEQGIRFRALSFAEIPASNIRLELGGQDVSAQLEIGGTPLDREVAFRQLQLNTFYVAEIRVENALGTTVRTLEFSTFNPVNAVEIEAEDYNFGGGQFIENPPPSGLTPTGVEIGGGLGYFDRQGQGGVDYQAAGTGGSDPMQIYRFTDSTTTRYSVDVLRSKYAASGAPDYDLWQFATGEWFNYTRTFAPGLYQVFVRAQAPGGGRVCLERVTSNPAVPGQTTLPLGVFTLTPSEGYQFAALNDSQGLPAELDLNGAITVRLVACHTGDSPAVNYLLFVQAPEESLELTNPRSEAVGFRFDFLTRVGATYVVEYKDRLDDPSWTLLESLTGTGNTQTCTDPADAQFSRFYRVRRN
ncbi:MAG TPA: hypothetical protein PK640_03595 [Verrucomicrobiota bacterium]|nr:hypothetical protein [Verrucomicrobiota bacterium]